MNSAARRALAGCATMLASGSLFLTVLARYATTIDSARFAGRALSVVRTDPVESLIVSNVARRLVASAGSQVTENSVRPLIDEAVRAALASEEVAAQVRDAAASLQRQLLSGQPSGLTLRLPEIGPAVAASVQSRSPQLAAEAETLGSITVVAVRIPPSAAQALNDLAYLGRDATLLIILTIALAALALLLSPNRRRTLIGVGAGACLSGLLAAAAYLGGREVVLSEFSSEDARIVASATWSVFLGGLEALAFGLAAGGAAAATVAAVARDASSARSSVRT